MMQVSFGDQPLSDGVGSGLAFPKVGGRGHPGVRAAPSAPAGQPPGFAPFLMRSHHRGLF